MRPVTRKTMLQLKGVFMDKRNSVVSIMSINSEGVTDLSRLYLGKTQKEREGAVKALVGMIPEDSGKLFCTVS